MPRESGDEDGEWLLLLAGGAQQHVGGDVGDEQRGKQERAAALVFLVRIDGFDTELVGRHALVLGAVVAGQA
jgi:hypothetical protein